MSRIDRDIDNIYKPGRQKTKLNRTNERKERASKQQTNKKGFIRLLIYLRRLVFINKVLYSLMYLFLHDSSIKKSFI